ncbi:MAG TPA: hypothetical protein DC013_07500 [Ruminococcaceae bacterium]|nr:hypothetical protein [Oscillospiraceae bacterium]
MRKLRKNRRPPYKTPLKFCRKGNILSAEFFSEKRRNAFLDFPGEKGYNFRMRKTARSGPLCLFRKGGTEYD